MAKRALCIGINDYPGTGMDLRGCVNDAEDWAGVLGARGYTVGKLLDSQATKAAMVESMKALIGSGTRGDSLVITYSGHGSYQPDDNDDETDGLDEALCPHDIALRGVGGALIDDEINTLFAARAAGVSLVLLSDSCHSGTVTRAATGTASSDEDPDAPRPRFLPMGNWLPDAKLPKRRDGSIARQVGHSVSSTPWRAAMLRASDDLLIAGCQEGVNNFSYDARFRGRSNGAFSFYALKTLAAAPSDLSYEAWHKAICEYLPSASYPQSPQIFGNTRARRRKVFS